MVFAVRIVPNLGCYTGTEAVSLYINIALYTHS